MKESINIRKVSAGRNVFDDKRYMPLRAVDEGPV